MDLKDMIAYRKLLNDRVERARAEGNQRVLNNLLKSCDVVDMVLDTAAFATITEIAPQMAVLTGVDFNHEILKLAMPKANLKGLTPTTQVEIKFEDATIVEGPDAPVEGEPAYVTEVRNLLKRGFTKNIQQAIEAYLKGTGKEILPADAWTEIKDMLQGMPGFETWDAHLATQYRLRGPVSAYAAVKKHLPAWGETEISRVCEDAIKRTIARPITPFSEAKILQDLIESSLDKKKINLWKERPENKEIMETWFKDIVDPKKVDNTLGRIIATMVPKTRIAIEEKNGRKPYVEKGYPA